MMEMALSTFKIVFVGNICDKEGGDLLHNFHEISCCVAATEFRLMISSTPPGTDSPAMGGCGHLPDLPLTRTPRKNARRRTVALRAPTPELKAVWQNLIQRQM